MSNKKVKRLVADSAAFLRNAQMQNIAEEIYTIRDVVGEIRDSATKQRLQVLPYELKFREPDVEAIKYITEFAKKTGDYPTLSAVDIRVLALTYQLELEAGNQDRLKKEPKMVKTVTVGPRAPEEMKPINVAGFYFPKGSHENEESSETKPEGAEDDKEGAETASSVESLAQQIKQVDLSDENHESQGESEEEEDFDDGEEEEDDDDGGWITPSNIAKVKQDMHGYLVEENVDVACLTLDFAMQNVLIQIGLHVIALDGRLIREAQTYILRCYACFHTTSNMTKMFCPSCGNKTLKRVAVTLNEDGSLQLHISTRRRLTPRGKKFSLPTPKGGKYSNNPILVEDQREAQKRPTALARQKTNALDDNYVAGNSPFVINDVYSRAALLGRRAGGTSNNWNRRNPNEAKRGGRRKR
nr:EOG090X07WR [Triops cancriformis]